MKSITSFVQIAFFATLLLGVKAKEEKSKVRGTRRALENGLGSVLSNLSSPTDPPGPVLNLAGLSGGSSNIDPLAGLDLSTLGKKSGSSSGAASGCDCDKSSRNKPTSLTFRYSSNGQNSLYQDSGKATCTAGSYPSSTTVSVNGQSFSVSDGTEFTVNNINGANTEFNVGGQSCSVHTSCSVPIVDGDQIGPFIVIGANGQSQSGINYCCGTCCGGSCGAPTPAPTLGPSAPPTEPPTPEPLCPKPFDETCPLTRPIEGEACKFFGNEITPMDLYQRFILNRQFQTITEPSAQAVARAGCRYGIDETETTQIDMFCICAFDNEMDPECGRTVCEIESVQLPTPAPTPKPASPDPICNPTDVCPLERPTLGNECDWADAGLCRYDQCNVPRSDGSMPEAEYFCACICDKPDTLCGEAVCELRLCGTPNEPWCPDNGLTVYREDFEESPNTFDQWTNGKKTTIGGLSTFLGPYSEGENRPCRTFNLQFYASSMARFSFDLYEYLPLSAGDLVGVSVGDELGNNDSELMVPLSRPSGITHNGELELSWEKYEDSKYKFNLDIRREFLYINNFDVDICFHWELVGDDDSVGFDNMELRICEDNCPPEPCCPFEEPKQNWPCTLNSNTICAYGECEEAPGTYATRCTCIDGRYECGEFSTCLGPTDQPTDDPEPVVPTNPPPVPTNPPPVPTNPPPGQPTVEPTRPPTRPPTLQPTGPPTNQPVVITPQPTSPGCSPPAEAPPGGCLICGDGQVVTAPDAIFEFPENPPFGCSELEDFGLNGAIPLDQCNLLSTIPELAPCQCAPGCLDTVPTAPNTVPTAPIVPTPDQPPPPPGCPPVASGSDDPPQGEACSIDGICRYEINDGFSDNVFVCPCENGILGTCILSA